LFYSLCRLPPRPSVPTRRSSDLDDSFVRPMPTGGVRKDVVVALALMVLSVTGQLGTSSLPGYEDEAKLPWSLLAIGLAGVLIARSEEHTSELQSRENLVCRLLLE